MPIPKDLLEEWKKYEVSALVINAMLQKKEELLNAMQFGQFVNLNSMENTFGMSANADGNMKGLNTFFEIIGEEEGGEDED